MLSVHQVRNTELRMTSNLNSVATHKLRSFKHEGYVVTAQQRRTGRSPLAGVATLTLLLLSDMPLTVAVRRDRLGEEPIGDILYFDYGCIAFWGLTQKQEQVRRAELLCRPKRQPC